MTSTIEAVTPQQINAVNDYMLGSIGDMAWPSAGVPSGWALGDQRGWFAAGNTAVLTNRAVIESGARTAGAIWCEAARNWRTFSYGPRDEAFLHDWFVSHRERITQIVANVAAANPVVSVEDATITVGGIEYVRKDVIDRDISALTDITHRASVDHSLCGVYDEVQRKVDEATSYIKMGPRYQAYTVVVEQVITVQRTLTVAQATDEAAARVSAVGLARDYDLTQVEGRRRGETVRVVSRGAAAAVSARITTT